MNGRYIPPYSPEYDMPQYTEFVNDGDGVYISAGGGTMLNISWTALGISPDQVRILGVLITYAWPKTEWTNGALVAINYVAQHSTHLEIGLATTCSQYYKLRIRVLYEQLLESGEIDDFDEGGKSQF